MPFQMAGRLIEANPSWPTATAQKLADTLAPDPPDDPPALEPRATAPHDVLVTGRHEEKDLAEWLGTDGGPLEAGRLAPGPCL